MPCVVGNASNSNAVFPETIGKNAALYAYNGTTSSNVTTTTTPLSNTSYQLFGGNIAARGYKRTATGTIFVNGTQIKQSTTMQNLNNVSRTTNYVGQSIGGVNFFRGGIAEIIIYSTPVSASQRKSIEAYVLGKYGIGNKPALDAPTFTPASGVYPINQSISIVRTKEQPVGLQQTVRHLCRAIQARNGSMRFRFHYIRTSIDSGDSFCSFLHEQRVCKHDCAD